jgi:putative transposase
MLKETLLQAGMIVNAEEYRWSSAGAHCGLKKDPLLATLPHAMEGISQKGWSDWLASAESQDVTDLIQRNIEKGLPCGNDNFIDKLELIAKKSLRYKPQGRPFKDNKG